jgi:hypothetical protein
MNTFIKVYASEVPNSKISLEKPVSISSLYVGIYYLDPNIKNYLQQFKSLYFWDLLKLASKHINEGDHLYIKTKSRIYHGIIDKIINDPSGYLGKSIGWKTRNENTSYTKIIVFNSIGKIPTKEIPGIRIEVCEPIEKNFYKV